MCKFQGNGGKANCDKVESSLSGIDSEWNARNLIMKNNYLFRKIIFDLTREIFLHIM